MCNIADPEEQNEDRADWAYEAVQTFKNATGLGDEDGLDTAVSDLLADLAHLCDREGLDFANLISRASNHYNEETCPDDGDADSGDQGKQFDCIDVLFADEAEPKPVATLVDYATEVRDALGRAADAIEDIDDPRHYSKDDLKEIKRKATLWRKLAQAPAKTLGK